MRAKAIMVLLLPHNEYFTFISSEKIPSCVLSANWLSIQGSHLNWNHSLAHINQRIHQTLLLIDADFWTWRFVPSSPIINQSIQPEHPHRIMLYSASKFYSSGKGWKNFSIRKLWCTSRIGTLHYAHKKCPTMTWTLTIVTKWSFTLISNE